MKTKHSLRIFLIALAVVGLIPQFFLHAALEKIRRFDNGIELVLIEPGQFETPDIKDYYALSKQDKEKFWHPVKNRRLVRVEKAFYLARYEVTNRQFTELMHVDKCKELGFSCGERHPAIGVNWYEAVQFANKLSEKYSLTNYYMIREDIKDNENRFPFDNRKWRVTINPSATGFRLPTEAQWELAYRAGTKTVFYWGDSAAKDTVHAYANSFFNSGYTEFRDLSGKKTFWYAKLHKPAAVGSRRPNAWGLFDMAGNVAEWCDDAFVDASTQAKNTGVRFLRGGSFKDAWPSLLAFTHEAQGAIHSDVAFGLRVALPAP